MTNDAKLPTADSLRKQNAERRKRSLDHAHKNGMNRAINAILDAHNNGKTEVYCQSFVESVVAELREKGYTVEKPDRDLSVRISW